MRIGIKFCGHCSPRRDMAYIEKRLKETGENHEFVYFAKDTHVDILLVLNACESACAAIPTFEGKIITATPETVDFVPVKGQNLAEAILEKLINL